MANEIVKAVTLQVRVSEKEARLIRVAAKKAEMTVSQYLRGTALLIAAWQLDAPGARRPMRDVVVEFADMMEMAARSAFKKVS